LARRGVDGRYVRARLTRSSGETSRASAGLVVHSDLSQAPRFSRFLLRLMWWMTGGLRLRTPDFLARASPIANNKVWLGQLAANANHSIILLRYEMPLHIAKPCQPGCTTSGHPVLALPPSCPEVAIESDWHGSIDSDASSDPVVLASSRQRPTCGRLAVLRQRDAEDVGIGDDVITNSSSPSLGELDIVSGCQDAVGWVCSEVPRWKQDQHIGAFSGPRRRK
jgi:hypothetical protein